MNSLYAILWLIMLAVSMACVFQYVGANSMCNFFPEGCRWWLLPAQLAALAFFAAVSIMNPWSMPL